MYIASGGWPGRKSDGPPLVGAGAGVLLEGTNVGALFGVGELGTRILGVMGAACSGVQLLRQRVSLVKR